VSIIMDGEKQEFKDSLMVDFDRTNNGFVLNTWSSGYSLYYNETSGDLSVIPFSAHEERQVNNDILLCSYSSSSSSSILYREQQGQYSKPIGRSKESRWIDIGLGQKQKIAYPYSYLTISPYDFTNIVWKYILDEGTPLNTLITVVNLGNIEVNNGQTIEENIWQAICDKNPDIDFTNYEDDIVFHSIHSTAAMVVGIQPRISGVVTVTYTLSFIAFRCDNYSEGV
jgi:hypothetical protein